MRPARRMIARALLATVMTLLVIGIAAPFIRADRYGQQIREAMERGLNRKVEIGNVKFNLFTGPGFTIEEVIIYDDPSAGIEPFAHMTSLEARVRISALLRGRIEFSRLRFVEPDVNIVKPITGPWNVVPLLQRTVAANTAAGAAGMPEIQVSDGRINFKFGDRKSPFYFMNADVIVAPRTAEKGAFLIRFSGEPARTDRAAQGFGEFTAAGRLLTGKGESRLELDVGVERGDVADMVTLFRGYPIGVHGTIAASAKVYGLVSNLQILGSVEIDEVHRWDVMPARTGGLGLKYRGSLDATTQRLELAAGSLDNPGVPVSARLIVDGVLSQPRWSADLSVDGMPASGVLAAVRHMGAPIPREVAVRGNVVGVVGYGPAAGLQGQLSIDGATVKLGSGPELTVEHAGLLVAGEELRLTPASVSGGGNSAELEAVFSPIRQRFDATIRGRVLPIASLASGDLIATAASPFVEHFSGGTWSGWIRYRSDHDDDGTWTANLDIRDTSTRVPGVAVPVRVSTASVELAGTDVTMRRMRLKVGEIEISGDYSYATRGDRHTFNAAIPAVTGQEIERIFLPTLHYTGLLARMRLTRSAVPRWLRERHAEGTLRIGTLVLGDLNLVDLESQVTWSGPAVRFSSLKGSIEEGLFTGDASVDLTGAEPEYKLNGNLTDVAWRGGRVDLSGAVTTVGTDSDFILNLESLGTFEARSVDLIAEHPVRSVAGSYGFGITRAGPQIKLTALQAAVGTERFLGQGSTQGDGKLQLELASANRVMFVSGPVAPFRLEVTTERAAGPTR